MWFTSSFLILHVVAYTVAFYNILVINNNNWIILIIPVNVWVVSLWLCLEKKIGKSEKTPVANDCIRDFCKVSWGFVAPTENSNLCKLKNKSANAWHWKKPACLTHLSEKDEKDSVNYILALKCRELHLCRFTAQSLPHVCSHLYCRGLLVH